MNKIIGKVLSKLFPTYGLHTPNVVLNYFKRINKSEGANKYLFILSPPYCGSTLLNELLSTSPSVSVNNPYGTREGQTLPSVRKMMFDPEKRWDENVQFDWNFIKKEWRKYWDTNKAVLLEKSPPNIIRAAAINEAFQNAFFIIFHRNPYAHCESLIRRNNSSAKAAARFAIICLEQQKINQSLALNSITISYEGLTTTPNKFKKQIIEFIPEVNNINFNTEFAAHNFREKKMQIENLNPEKIKNLSQNQLDEINEVFFEHEELLKYFHYDLINRSLNQ